MNVLFLSYLFPPDPNGGATRVRDLAQIWSAGGLDVTVGTSFPSHPHGRLRPEHRWQWCEESVEDGVTVVRSWRYATPNRGFVRRVWAFITMAISMFLVHLRRRPPDVVVATSPPLFVGIAGWALSRVMKVPFVLDVRDLWPQQAIDLGVLRNAALIRGSRWLEHTLYRDSAAVVTVTGAFREAIVSAGTEPAKVHLIRNGVNCSRLRPTADRPAARRRVGGPQDGLLVTYVGTFGLSQGLSTVIDAARRLGPAVGVRFLLVGDGAEWELIAGKAADLPYVEVRRAVPPAEVPAIYHASDIGVVVLRDLQVFQQTVPSKMFEYGAAGVPVVIAVRGEARELIVRSGGGIGVPPEDAQALADGIAKLAADPKRREAYGRNARAWVESDANRLRQAHHYLEVLRSVQPRAPTFKEVGYARPAESKPTSAKRWPLRR